MFVATLVLFLAAPPPALSDTGDTGDTGGIETCRDWEITPDESTVYSGQSRSFGLDVLNECRSEMTCTWSLSSNLGELVEGKGLKVEWYAPADPPPECETQETSVTATCTWRGFTKNSTAAIRFRCTAEERAQNELSQVQNLSVAGGGCSNRMSGESALLLLPLALFGRRRKL